MKRLLLLVGMFVLATVLFGGSLNVQKVSAFEADFVVDPAPDDVPDFAPIVSPEENNTNTDPSKIVGRPEVDKEPSDKCSSIFDASISDCIDAGVAWFIKNTLLMYSGWILWLAATMMNYSIDLGILQFSRWATDSLYPIWAILRQIVSLFVVFAGLYLGFMYILGKENTFEKYLPWVIIFALFVNFSYPLVRTAVDISNVISLNIYTSAVGSGALDGTVEPEKTAGAIIRSRLGLSGMIDFTTGNTGSGTSALNKINSAPAALLAVLFVLYAAYIFFMVTILMALRTAALVILIVASPLLLIDSVIPKLGEISVKMRKILFEQLALAPVFTIMLALTLKFLDVFQTGGPLSGTNVAGVSGGASGTTMFFNLLMMLIMLHIMLKVTKSVSGSVGEYATRAVGTVGNFATSAAVGAATGGTGLLARASIGRAAAAVRDSGWMERNQDSFVGRRMYDMSNSVAKSSFDLRNSSVLAGGAGALGLSTKGMGAGAKGGYEEDLTRKTEDRKARYGRIKTINDNGTINQKGTEAKQRFFTSQGTGGNLLTKSLGITTNKENVGKALLEEDRAVAIKDNDSIDRYNNAKSPEKRQSYFKAEKDLNLKNQFLKIDQSAADKENATRDEQREISEAKSVVYDSSVGQRRQDIYNYDMSPEEQARARATDGTLAKRENATRDEQREISEAKSVVYDSSVGQRRQDIYNYDMSPEEQARARATDGTLAKRENESRDEQKAESEAKNSAPLSLESDSQMKERLGPQSEKREGVDSNTSTTVGDTIITSTTINNVKVDNVAGGRVSTPSTPAGYTQNSGGVVLVPRNMSSSRPSLSGLSGGGGVDVSDQPTFNKSSLTLNEDLGRMPTEEEIDSIVKTLLPMNEESRKKALGSLSPNVANRILNDPRLQERYHNAMTDDAMDILL